jgi:Ca2+-binding EF-hand superfamily protein
MLSDLRRRKFAAMYNATDVNDNGVLDRADFLAVAEKFAARNGWEEGSDGYAGMHALCAGWWERMRADADTDGDGVVTVEEFCATLEGYDEAAFAPTAQLLFGALDPSGDGVISAAEYRGYGDVFRMVGDTDEIFARLDTDGDGRISRDEFAQRFAEWAVGEDESAAGNWLYGEF